MIEASQRFLPNQLVNIARSMMRVPRPDLIGTWPRAVAILGRQALEIALDQFWVRTAPGVEAASRRAQLICLPAYTDTEPAMRVRHAWHGLSGACHYHAYDLPPVESELNGWLDDVEALIKELSARSSAGSWP